MRALLLLDLRATWSVSTPSVNAVCSEPTDGRLAPFVCCCCCPPVRRKLSSNCCSVRSLFTRASLTWFVLGGRRNWDGSCSKTSRTIGTNLTVVCAHSWAVAFDEPFDRSPWTAWYAWNVWIDGVDDRLLLRFSLLLLYQLLLFLQLFSLSEKRKRQIAVVIQQFWERRDLLVLGVRRVVFVR